MDTEIARPAVRSFRCHFEPARVLDPARWSKPPGHDQETLAASHFEVGFISRGSLWWHSNQRLLKRDAGCAYLMCPGGRSRSRVPPAQRNHTRGWKITFEWPGFEFLRGDSDGTLAIDEVILTPPSARRELNSAFEAIHRLYLDAPLAWELKASGHLLVILASMASLTSADTVVVGRQHDRRLAASLAFIWRDTFARPFKIAAAAEATGLTEDYFRRRFHEVLGLTPHRYVKQLRHRTRPAHPGGAAADVGGRAGRAAGFGDAKHFSRLFRQCRVRPWPASVPATPACVARLQI